MTTTINASTTLGLQQTADTSGVLALQTANTTALTLDASQNATFAGYVNAPNTFGFKNRIINGGMMIDQRNAGASVTAGSGYTLDRWNVDRVWPSSTVTIQQSSTAPAGFSNSMVATVSTGAAVAAGSYFSIQQFIEGYNVADMDFGKATAQQFTVSFWVRSSVTGTFGVGFRNGAFDLSYWTTYTVNAANTWEQKYVTITAPTSGTWYTNSSYGLNVIFSLGCGSTNKATSNNAWNAGGKLGAVGETDLIATTGATFYITGVQLEKGSTATSFDYRPYGTELALCQRYYYRVYDSVPQYYTVANGVNYNTTGGASVPIPYLPMRATPSATLISGTFSYSGNGGSASSFTLVPYSGLFSVNYTGTSFQSWGVANINNSSATPLTVALSSEL